MLVLLVSVMMLLLFAGLPVAFSLGAVGAAGFYSLLDGVESFAQIPLIAYKSLDDFVLARFRSTSWSATFS